MNWRAAIVCIASVQLFAACSLPAESTVADGLQSPEALLVITGNLYYPERIALPRDGLAVVELGDIRLHPVRAMDLALPFIARGQDPGWQLRVSRSDIDEQDRLLLHAVEQQTIVASR